MVEFGLLGPLDVRREGEPVGLRRGRPRAVLIALVLRAGRVVPAEVLIEQVWGDQRPVDAGNALHVQVSYLRRALGLRADGPAPALRTEGGGYVLEVEPGTVDVQRFEAAVAAAERRLADGSAAQAEAALIELRDALVLWRGEALQDVALDGVVVAEVERLRELRVLALEHEIDGLLLLGRHDQAVPALHRHVADHPLRERFRAQMMLALYRSGRQAEALRAFDAARRHLVDELGVEPGAALQRLHRAVLAQDAALDWAPAGPDAPVPAPVAAPVPDGATRPAPLPAPVTRLVGRDRELTRLRDLLAEGRLVTLTGPGGVGKTRLALAVAAVEAERRPVWLVELGPVGDAAVVPYEIAHAVGVSTVADPVEAVAAGSATTPGLLVLDTCEHLVDACAEAVHRLLRACPQLAVLATSRQPLAVPGEVAFPVPPLAVPGPGASVDEVRSTAAALLFAERGRGVRADFAIDPASAADVARICRIVDGLPLAIELAAAQLRVLSPTAVLRRLDDRFALLSRAGRAVEVRQRSLRATITWSYDLLDDDQQRFFRRLGVFAGRFTFDAASAVAGAGLDATPLALLTTMVDHSLVVPDPDPTPDVHDGLPDAYLMLDSLRAYAADRLDEHPADRDAARGRLVDWLVGHGELADRRLRSADQQAALAALRAEVPNIRAALEWSFSGRDAADPAAGARLAAALSWFWAIEAANDEAARWLGRGLAVPGLADRTRARLLPGAGLHDHVLGRLAAGQRSLEEAVELWDRLGEPEQAVTALVYLGNGEHWLGDPDVAAATHDRAIAVAREHGDDWGLAWSLVWRASTAIDQGDDALLASLLDESHRLAERVDDPRALGWIVGEVANAELVHGEAGAAVDHARRAVERHEATGWNEGMVAALAVYGRALIAVDRAGEAMGPLHRALRVALELAQPYAVGDALEALAGALAGCGEHEAAAGVLGTSARLREQMGAVAYPLTQRGRTTAALATSLRATLGDAAFDAAHRRGQQRSPADVITAVTPR